MLVFFFYYCIFFLYFCQHWQWFAGLQWAKVPGVPWHVVGPLHLVLFSVQRGKAKGEAYKEWDNGDCWTAVWSLRRATLHLEEPAICVGEVPSWQHFAQLCSTNGRCLHQQSSAGIQAHGCVCLLHPNILLPPDKVPVPLNSLPLGEVQMCSSGPVKTIKGCSLVRWWSIWQHGPQCQVWCLYHVLLHGYEDSPLWASSGNSIHYTYLSYHAFDLWSFRSMRFII